MEVLTEKTTKVITPDDAEFWELRGIDPIVRYARYYPRYRHDDPTPVRDAYARLKTDGQKAKVVSWAKQSDGILIYRHAALPGLPSVFPEMRPDNPIRTGQQTRHWHGYGEPPEDDRWYRRMRPRSSTVKKPEDDAGLAHRWKWHAEPIGKMTDAQKKALERGEEPPNTEEVHLHDDLAKYVFPPDPWTTTDPREHQHHTSYPIPKNPPKRGKYSNVMEAEERRRRHVEKYHNGVDRDDAHPHEWKVKDRQGLARRLDVHPFAAPLFDEAELVYFVIEGCLKSDSVLSAIRREGRPESVFSVPSVSLWLADELDEFIDQKLLGKTVIVIPDADWYKKDEVIEQARLCCLYLTRRGVRAFVAAPPHEESNKGIDDHLGAGRSLDELLVQNRRVDRWGMNRWLYCLRDRRAKRKNTMARTTDALYGLGYGCDDKGVFSGTLKRFSRIMNVSISKVQRTVRDLEEWGAISINGDLTMRKNYFSGQWEWDEDEEPPVITLIPRLRGTTDPYFQLGDLSR